MRHEGALRAREEQSAHLQLLAAPMALDGCLKRIDGHAENAEEEHEGREAEMGLVTLPKEMVEGLRVNLAVWREGTEDHTGLG